MVEKTPDQIALERSQQLLNDLWYDGEIGQKIRARAKEKFPDVRLTDDIAEPFIAPVRDELAATRKQLAELQERLKAKDDAADEQSAKAKLQSALDAAREKFNLTADGYNQMIERMKDTGNYSDAEAAAAWVASTAPPASPKGPTWAPQDLDLFGVKNHDEKMAKLHRDPQGYMDAELSEFVRDPDAYVRETFGRVA